MDRYYHAVEAVPIIVKSLNMLVASALQDLLETKHVYQKVSVDAEGEFGKFTRSIYGDDERLFQELAAAAVEGARLTPSDRELITEEKNGTRNPVLLLLLKSVKLFCSACDSREAFRPIWWSDATNELRKPSGNERLMGRLEETYQIFTLVYQCQRCTGTPATFLVRRAGWQLFLDGRSPFEEVEVPAFIPRTERWLYRDALIAQHGGKTLAALFYLRTFIEQFARRLTPVKGRVTGDELMAAYGQTLPEKQRDHMPSLKDWYERLSGAIHSASQDEALFESAREAIDQHFDFRRLFRIDEQSVPRSV